MFHLKSLCFQLFLLAVVTVAAAYGLDTMLSPLYVLHYLILPKITEKDTTVIFILGLKV